MPTTNTRTDYITLYRTFAEMYENLDFIQTLERLQTGEPTNMHGSSVSGKVEGTNRPIARLAHGLDSLLDQMMLLKTVSVEAAGSTKITWNGTNVVANAAITITIHLVAAGQISAAPSGKIEYSVSAFTKNMSSKDWGYVTLPMDPTGATTLTVSTATDAELQTQLAGSNRMKILPLFYKTSTGQIVWMLGGRQSIHQGFDYFPGTGQNMYYGKNTNVHALTSISISGTGNVSWIKNGATSGAYNLTLPTLTVTGPSISQTVSGATYTSGTANDLQAGHALFIDTSSGSVSVESLNSSNFSNSDNLRAMICARVGNDVYFWNGLKLIGTSGAGTGTTVDLFNFQQQLVRLVDDGTSFYLDIVSNSDGNFTDNRTLTLDTGDGDRLLKFKGVNTYTFNASAFSMEGNITTAAGTRFQLNENCTLDLLGPSSNPSVLQLNEATIDLETGCSIDLNTTSSITASNSTLALGTGNAVSFGANFAATGAVSITSPLTVSATCTIDQNLSTASDVKHSGLTLEDPTAFLTLSNFNNGTNFPEIISQHAHGTASVPASADQNDYLLSVVAKGYNATSAAYDVGGYIYVTTDSGSSPASIANDMPSYMRFGTSPGGGTIAQERMRILSNGNIGMGVTDPDAALEVFKPATQLKLSYDATTYAQFVVDATDNLDIDTSSSGKVTINSKHPRIEYVTILVALNDAAATSTHGFAIPTLDGVTRASQGSILGELPDSDPTNSLADWGISTSKEKAGSIWVAPNACKIREVIFSSEVSFGSYDASGGMQDSDGDNYPGFGAIDPAYVVPAYTKIALNFYKLAESTTAAQGGLLSAGAGGATITDVSSCSFLYAAIFDASNVLGAGATDGTSTFSVSYAGRSVTPTLSSDISLSKGDGLLIRLKDPTAGGSLSSPESHTHRLISTGAGASSAPWVKVVLLVEYPV